MIKSNKIKKSVAAATFVVICGVFSQTSFAKSFADKIIKTISCGHITAVQSESPSQVAVPDNLKGKIFDKNKKLLTIVSKDTGKIYTESGEEIVSFSDGKIVTLSEAKNKNEKANENKLIVKDANSLNKYTCFNVKMPSYLPTGYKFDRAEFYKDKDGNVNKKYINLFFINKKFGKHIYIQQRFADKDTGYVAGTEGNIEKVKVNGKDAILSDDRNLDFENNGVLYGLSGIGKDEILKIAESIK